ncbi:MAG: hypothetical protein AABW50_04030 [Nanoarchaeota archaeon]
MGLEEIAKGISLMGMVAVFTYVSCQCVRGMHQWYRDKKAREKYRQQSLNSLESKKYFK